MTANFCCHESTYFYAKLGWHLEKYTCSHEDDLNQAILFLYHHAANTFIVIFLTSFLYTYVEFQNFLILLICLYLIVWYKRLTEHVYFFLNNSNATFGCRDFFHLFYLFVLFCFADCCCCYFYFSTSGLPKWKR